MHKDYQDLDYLYPEIGIKHVYLKVVDRVLLVALGRLWECMHDITQHKHQDWKTRPTPQKNCVPVFSVRVCSRLLIMLVKGTVYLQR